MNNGFIVLFRKFLDWEWYDDHNTKIVFLHCLLIANHKDKKYRGTVVKKGTFLTSYELLAAQCGLTVSKVRTSLEKLKMTNELAINSTRQGTVISVVKWADYQDYTPSDNQPNSTQVDSEIANESQTNRKRVATNNNDNNVTSINNKEIIEAEKNQKIQEELPTDSKEFIPPTLEQVSDYCKQRNNTIDPEAFIDYYQLNDWFVGKNKNKQKMKDWKASVRTWERNDKKKVEKLHERNNTDDTTVPEGIGTIL